MGDFPELLTPEDVLRLLRCEDQGVEYVRSLREHRGLPYLRLKAGFVYPRDAVLAWIDTETEPTKKQRKARERLTNVRELRYTPGARTKEHNDSFQHKE